MQSHIVLSELPEPPIPLSEIGPIPPPPMFSTPSPTMATGRQHSLQLHSANVSNMNALHTSQMDYNEYDYEDEDDSDVYRYPDDADSEEEYMLQQNINVIFSDIIPILYLFCTKNSINFILKPQKVRYS